MSLGGYIILCDLLRQYGAPQFPNWIFGLAVLGAGIIGSFIVVRFKKRNE